MDEYSITPQGVVDPEVRAYVTSLVTALGGTGGNEDGRYILGDDALACLRDMKRWLRLYDEKLNRLDVARVLAERDLVKGDLLQVLGQWPEKATEDRVKSKIALACFELLVPLTWPMEKNEEQATANHYRNLPYLQLAQIHYKREILEHPSMGILRAAVRVALPALALQSDERTVRDEGIIKLVLYFLRNMALITAPENLPVEWNENEVSASATITAFHQQDIFSFLLTMASNIEEFGSQDTVLLEIIFHLVKGVEVDKLFFNDTQLDAKRSDELRGLMKKEASMLQGYAKVAPSRHNRFGTMIWMKREDGRVSSVSGQDVLSNGQQALKKLDETKRVNRPKQRVKEEVSSSNFNKVRNLTNKATQQMRSFVEDFLDSGFNPLFHHLRRALEREDDRILLVHWQQYFYLIGWFLEADRMRRRQTSRSHKINEQLSETNDYSVVASVLNQETFILISRFMDKSLEHKVWLDVHAVIRGFTQILLTVQEMAQSSIDEDREIADNIQNRIFYEETTHDMVLKTLKEYKDQGFSYLNACTELAHVFLRLLEQYSKQNLDLQVRSRRRGRNKPKADKEGQEQGAANDSEAEEVAEAQKVSRERKFDFNRCVSKFVTQSSVNTFTTFLTYYQDLSKEQLKRAHRFFYRVAFKHDMSVMLFRLDIVHLLLRMVQGPTSLDKTNSMFPEWQEFVKQIFRLLTKKMQERPALGIEILFSKITSTAFYLEYGYDKQTMTSTPKAAAELEVKGSLPLDDQIGVVIAALLEEHLDGITFVEDTLKDAANERQSWADEAEARKLQADGQPVEVPDPPAIVVRPDSEERRVQMFKNGRLRLLLKLVGIKSQGIEDEPNATWIIPSTSSWQTLSEAAKVVEKHKTDPRLAYGDDQTVTAEQMLRRKTEPRIETDRFLVDDDDSDGIAPDEEVLFPAGGPTMRKPDALEELKKRRRKRRRSNPNEEPDEEVIKARKRARQLADLEKRRKIKSTEFVEDSDDNDDAEFFAQEEVRRLNQAQKVREALTVVRGPSEGGQSPPPPKRKRIEDDDGDDTDSGSEKRSRHSREGMEEQVDDDVSLSSGSEADALEKSTRSQARAHSEEANDSDTPPSSQMDIDNEPKGHPTQLDQSSEVMKIVPGQTHVGEEDEDEEEEAQIQPAGRRRRAIVDDDDDDD